MNGNDNARMTFKFHMRMPKQEGAARLDGHMQSRQIPREQPGFVTSVPFRVQEVTIPTSSAGQRLLLRGLPMSVQNLRSKLRYLGRCWVLPTQDARFLINIFRLMLGQNLPHGLALFPVNYTLPCENAKCTMIDPRREQYPLPVIHAYPEQGACVILRISKAQQERGACYAMEQDTSGFQPMQISSCATAKDECNRNRLSCQCFI